MAEKIAELNKTYDNSAVKLIDSQSSSQNDKTSFSKTIPKEYDLVLLDIGAAGFGVQATFPLDIVNYNRTFDNNHGLLVTITYNKTTRALSVSKHSSSTQGGWSALNCIGIKL